ncbi:MAG: hypothetical protein U0169_07660 [Polyangiaceae bacterium]
MTAGRTSDRRRPSWGALRENAAFVVFAMGAIVVTFDLFVWGYGEDPSSMLRLLAFGTWGTAYGIGQVLFKATPILFTGVAVDVALRAGLFNIGAEGQLVMGSLVGALVGAALPAGTPWFVALPVVLSSAAAAGAAWALVPAWLRARYGAHEVIASIMMNRIAASLVAWAMARGAALPGRCARGTWSPALDCRASTPSSPSSPGARRVSRSCSPWSSPSSWPWCSGGPSSASRRPRWA